MLTEQSFQAVTRMFHSVSGIHLSEAKRPLVTGRLHKLAQERGIDDLNRYVSEVLSRAHPDELVRVVDKLTTNETYFFREPEHFKFLGGVVDRMAAGSSLRVWSAASSSGEEGYSIAMLLAERLGLARWEVLGTDLSTAMVEQARRGLYPMERARHVPAAYLKRWCLKGHGDYDGRLLVSRDLRSRVRFECANLTQDLGQLGSFDVIFLRNVLIYFDAAGKVDIVRRVLAYLKPGGHLLTGHAESISNLDLPVRSLMPAVYVHA